MEFNSTAFTIERIAADVFWTYVFENDFRETISSITDNVPFAMWSYERAEKEISKYFNYDLNVEAKVADPEIIKGSLVNAVYGAVLSVSLQHIITGSNGGRPPFDPSEYLNALSKSARNTSKSTTLL